MRKNVLALGLPFTFSLFAIVACTVTTNDNSGLTDAGPATPGTDAGASSSGDAGHDSGSSGDASLLGFVPSNLGDALVGIDTTTLGDVAVSGEQVFDTVTPSCAGQPCVAKTFTAANGATVGLFVAKSWKIDPAAHVTVRAGSPLVLVALSTIDIEGALDDGAITDRGADFGFPSAFGGAGTGAGGAGTNGPGGTISTGAGGGAYCGVGGKGGNVNATNGNAGVKYGGPTLIPLVGGSKGGTGAGAGGAGGGAVQLVAGTSITIGAGGLVNANGGGGGPGGSVSTGQASGGGGSGGGILFEAPAITIAGTVVANGGGGGGNGGATAAGGQDGQKSATPALGGNAAKDPSGGGVAGGSGAAGATIDGTNGDAPNADYSAGGGGGGAGYIRFNSTTGAATITGIVSPSLGTCTTQGTLAR